MQSAVAIYPTEVEQIAYYDKFFQTYSRINTRVQDIETFFIPKVGGDAATVLEIGCGIGLTSEIWIRKGFELLGVDFSRTGIERCRKELADPYAQFVRSNIMEFNTPRTFDVVTMFDFLEHLPMPDHKALFDKVGYWLKSDGLVFIAIPEPHHLDDIRKTTIVQPVDQSLYDDHLSRLFEHSGFEIANTGKADVYKYYILRKAI